MLTGDEKTKIKEIRKLAEEGNEQQVSQEERQWVLDLFKRNSIPMPKDVLESAKQMGYNVDGIDVLLEDDEESN